MSTTFNEPYNVARRALSLDHVSDGRAGFNAVTTLDPAAAQNFGLRELPSHVDRYARAAEFLEVVTALWDSWEDGAPIAHRGTGRFADTGRVHPIDHHGRFFDVGGSLALPRSPQGRPIISQAGASEQGLDLAAKFADIVYTAQLSVADAYEFRQDLRRRTAAYGRPPEAIKVLVGVTVLVEPDVAAARERQHLFDGYLGNDYRIHEVAYFLSTDPERLTDLDMPLPDDVISAAEAIEQGAQGFAKPLVKLAARGQHTVRELLEYSYGFLRVVGGPTEHADVLEDWFKSGAADGFLINPELSPRDMTAFVDHVVPELRRRRVLRREYRGKTLRDNLALPEPMNRWSGPQVSA